MKRLFLFTLLGLSAIIAAAQPILCGHRGSLWGVENTEQSFIAGANKGYVYLETDVKVSGDGHFVLSHDDTTNRLGGNLTVASATLAQLKAETYKQTRGSVAYTGKICTLEEYLQICKDYHVKPLIELKWATGINNNETFNLNRLVDTVVSYGFGDEAIILTSMRPCLQHVRRNYPNFKLQFLCNTNWETYFNWCVENKIDVDIEKGSFNKATVERFHEAGRKVGVWTVNDNAGYQTYGNYGCDFITVDYLDPTNLPEIDEFSRLVFNQIDYPNNFGTVKEYYEPELTHSIKFNNSLKDLNIKKVLFNNNKFYVLSEKEGLANIHIVNANTGEIIKEMDTPAINCVDCMLSDIAFTADGKLMATFKVSAESMWYLYTWENDTAPHELFLSTKLNAVASTIIGQSFCVSGNLVDCKIYVLSYSEHSASYGIYGLKVENGAIVSSVINQSAVYTKSAWGDNVVISTSPFSRNNIIIDSPTINPNEFSFNWDSNGKPMTSFMSMSEEFTNLKARNISFFRYGGQVYSLFPNMNDTYSDISISMMDATKGLKSLIPVTDNLNVFNSNDISTYVMTTATTEKGYIYIHAFVAGIGICKYEIEGEADEGNSGVTDFKLEKIWSYTDNEGNAPANIGGSDIQQGAAHKGLFYINDSKEKLVYIHTKDGLLGTLSGGEGWGIACDDAGNIIVTNDKSTGTEHQLLIYPKGTITNNVSPLKMNITLNEGGQTNFISASGNVLGDKGGYVYFFPNKQQVINMVQIKNGVVETVKTSGTISLAGSTAGYVIPIKNNPANWLYQVRGNGIYEYNGSDKGVLMKASTSEIAPNANTTLGGEFFTLSYHNILIYNSGSHYLGGFTIKDITNNKVISSVTPIGTKSFRPDDGNKSTANWTFAEKIDAGSYYIYQYCPANGIAVYRFYDANYVPNSIRITTNESSLSDIVIYPTPASNLLHFKSNEMIKKVSIYSLSGNSLIEERGEDISTINIENLNKGFFLIKINNIVKKFVKI